MLITLLMGTVTLILFLAVVSMIVADWMTKRFTKKLNNWGLDRL